RRLLHHEAARRRREARDGCHEVRFDGVLVAVSTKALSSKATGDADRAPGRPAVGTCQTNHVDGWDPLVDFRYREPDEEAGGMVRGGPHWRREPWPAGSVRHCPDPALAEGRTPEVCRSLPSMEPTPAPGQGPRAWPRQAISATRRTSCHSSTQRESVR